MITISYLSDLVPGEAAVICDVSPCQTKKRLFELGFVAGTQVLCLAAAPFGGPQAYLLRGTLIALRQADARAVNVQRVPFASDKCRIYKQGRCRY